MNRCILYWGIVALLCLSSLADEGENGDDSQTKVVKPEAQPVVIQKGGNLVLECQQQNCKEVEWYLDAVKIDDTQGSGFVITNKQTEGQDCQVYSTLTKADAQIEDSNKYTCQVKNGKDSYIVQVWVVETLILSFKNKDGRLSPNQDVTLQCDVEGMTSYHPMLWWRYGEQIKPDGQKYDTHQSNNSLTIKNTVLNDVGEYVCGFNYQDATFNKTVSLHSEPYVHHFEAKSKNLVEGDPLVLDCKVKGYPVPNITWLKDDELLDFSDPRISADVFEGIENATLRINNLDFPDRAEYKCVASNQHDSANATILVRVKNKLAALWPFLGICAEVIVLCIIIFIYEKRRAKKMEEEEETPEEAGHLTNSHDHKGKDDVRHRK